ncbi:MAG: threonine aldolase family protein [Sandaracinaceae bacterium]
MTAPVDLRSDTVTRPTAAMRRAMADAEVGDDIYGEDPTARRLEAEVAEILGQEAALFVPSGTMGNQLALLLHCRPGDDVVVGEEAHVVLYESGAAAALAGVQHTVAGRGGTFGARDLEAALFPTSAYYQPRSRLVVVENTHNRAGGLVWPPELIAEVLGAARQHGLATHLDGARLWNAAVASGRPEADLARGFDTVSVCFSKGLGAPVGSALAGSVALITEARRRRKMLGGAMRQVGILCAGALHALRHHRSALVEDHRRARRLAEALAEVATVNLASVQTNLVYATVPDAPGVAERAAAAGVLVGAMGPTTLRAVAHRDVGDAGVDRAIRVLREACGG